MKILLILSLFLSISVFGQAQRTYDQYVPTGAVMAFARTTCPTGWLEANGSQAIRTDYPNLFAVMGTMHGTNGTTDFYLPDYRGRFLRGVDKGANNDPDRASRTAMRTGGAVGDNVGSIQGDAMRNITGDFYTQSPNASSTGVFSSTQIGTADAGTGGLTNRYQTLDASRQVPTGGDNRPKNVNVLYCIKF